MRKFTPKPNFTNMVSPLVSSNAEIQNRTSSNRHVLLSLLDAAVSRGNTIGELVVVPYFVIEK